ncbi:MAG: glycosyltransferase family 4 protein [Chlorobi bacterium]|nr:glycosyltransferase family 4 protein [Chlorobiota bacterium]
MYFIIAGKFNIIDIPNHRSSHSKVTIRGGGIIVPVAFIIYEIVNDFPYPCFFAGLILISIVSFTDDIIGLSSKLRLGVQVLSVLLMIFDTGGIPVYVAVIILFVITGFINGYNFMDGINGMTGVYSLVLALSLLYVNEFQIHYIDTGVIIYIIIPVIIFLVYNFRTAAKCFAGDVGSVSLAYIFSFLILLLVLKTGEVCYLFMVSVYGIDVVFTIIKRIRLKQNILEAHRMHLYQYLVNESGISHKSVSLLYGGTQALINILTILIMKYSTNNIVLKYSFCIIMSVVVLLIYTRIRRRISEI